MKKIIKLSYCIKNKQFLWNGSLEKCLNLLGHCAWSFPCDCAFSVRSGVSWLGVWSLQKETELSSHMVPFFITNPIYWHLKLHFSEIFD